jgi:hypothetical protein
VTAHNVTGLTNQMTAVICMHVFRPAMVRPPLAGHEACYVTGPTSESGITISTHTVSNEMKTLRVHVGKDKEAVRGLFHKHRYHGRDTIRVPLRFKS